MAGTSPAMTGYFEFEYYRRRFKSAIRLTTLLSGLNFAMPPRHSTFKPADFTTLAHFAVSSVTSLPNSAALIGIGSPPRS
jgi:hypothetical protein